MFGPMLREWRTARRYSQSHLAEQAEVSTRHLSCLERGVSAPSRQMVLVLASALDVPLRERNSLLQAAGFASAYRERDLDDLELEPVRQALRFILDQTEPNAAVVVDRLWTIRMMNRPFEAFLSWILERPVSPGMNLARLTVDPSALGRYIVNAAALNDVFIERVRREAQVDNDAELHALVEDLRELAGPPRPFEMDPMSLLIPVCVEKQGLRASLFTTLTTLSTPLDVTLQELRIESYFPADTETRDLLLAGF